MPDMGQDRFDSASFGKSSTTRTSTTTSGKSTSTFTETVSNISGEFSLAEIVGTILAVIALLFGIAMIAGWVSINAMTVSIVTFSAATPTLGLLVKGVKGRRRRK